MMKQFFMMLIGRSPSGLNCKQVGLVLQEYLDGHLDDEQARKIEDHLEDCLRCGLEAETYERIKASLASQRAPVSEGSLARLRSFGEQLANGEDGTLAPGL